MLFPFNRTMKSITYKIAPPSNFSDSEKGVFLNLLILQNKVTNPTLLKINRCSILGVCKINDEIVSIAAIKPKTNSDFDSEKAAIENMRTEFKLELGYCFTLIAHTGNGYSSSLVKYLIEEVEENLMASTELRADNVMSRILIKNGFSQFGNPWKSKIHGGSLGLFLKFKK